MLNLNNVTCVITDFKENKDKVVNLLNFLKTNINFSDIKFIIQDNEHYSIKNDGIEFISHKRMNLPEYNEFCVYELNTYVDTDHCMLIQLDGHPINFDKWQNNFLDFDYIGASWLSTHPWVTSSKNYVGNGGFCIRSKKFLQEASKIHYKFNEHHINEDVFLCCFGYEYFKSKGIKFADRELATKFSIEKFYDEHNNLLDCFGYHGKEHLNFVKNKFNL